MPKVLVALPEHGGNPGFEAQRPNFAVLHFSLRTLSRTCSKGRRTPPNSHQRIAMIGERHRYQPAPVSQLLPCRTRCQKRSQRKKDHRWCTHGSYRMPDARHSATLCCGIPMTLGALRPADASAHLAMDQVQQTARFTRWILPRAPARAEASKHDHTPPTETGGVLPRQPGFDSPPAEFSIETARLCRPLRQPAWRRSPGDRWRAYEAAFRAETVSEDRTRQWVFRQACIP